MGQKSGPTKEPAEQVIREIRRSTRRQFSAEEKIRIVLSGLRGEDSIAELCRREGIVDRKKHGFAVPIGALQPITGCPASAPVRQKGRVEEGRISGPS